MIKNVNEHAADNKLFLEDICRETGRLFKDVSEEYYMAYVASAEDINYEY